MLKKKVSGLPKTWLFDIDGTLVKHNGYKIDGKDTILPGVKEFWEKISEEDKVILLTSRTYEYKQITESFLTENGIRFDEIIYNLPYGERILVNDKKPKGLETALAFNTERDVFLQTKFEIDESL